jgi:hypothetical protein
VAGRGIKAGAWLRTEARGSGTDWPVWAARPILDFIRRVHDAGAADIRWHTTWQEESATFAAAVGLPDFPVLPCPEYAEYTTPQRLGGAIPTGAGWWKLAAARRVVEEEGRPLLWTDDDVDLKIGRTHDVVERLRTTAPVLIVCPRQHLGLTRKHLRAIAAFLDLPD